MLAGCAADGRWTGAIGLLLGSVVDSFQAFPGSKVPRLATKRVAGSWHLPQRREEQPPLASPSSSRGSLPFLLGWLGCACGLCLSLLAATADPLVPDAQLEEFGLAAAAASSRAGCRRGMGQMGEGTTSPVTGLECFKTAWIERPASGLFDRYHLERWKKGEGEKHAPYLPGVRGHLAAGSCARNGGDAISDGSHIPPHWRVRGKRDDRWPSLVALEALQMEWNRATA